MKLLLALSLALAACTPAVATSTTTYAPLTSGFVALSPASSGRSGNPRDLSPAKTEVPSGAPGGLPTPSPTPPPMSRPSGRVIPPALGARGWATYQPGSGLWASPSGYIRDWPGTWVKVCGPVACRKIELRNECACGDRHGLRTLLDLSVEAWVAVCGSDTGQGICLVQVTRP